MKAANAVIILFLMKEVKNFARNLSWRQRQEVLGDGFWTGGPVVRWYDIC